MMNKCREEFEKWKMSIGGSEYDYDVWQDAWNARQPEANMLDLGGLERFGLVEDSTWYNCIQPKEDGDYVRYSDLHNLVAPVIGREDLIEMLGGWIESEGIENLTVAYDVVADDILDRIKGVTK